MGNDRASALSCRKVGHENELTIPGACGNCLTAAILSARRTVVDGVLGILPSSSEEGGSPDPYQIVGSRMFPKGRIPTAVRVEMSAITAAADSCFFLSKLEKQTVVSYHITRSTVI